MANVIAVGLEQKRLKMLKHVAEFMAAKAEMRGSVTEKGFC